MVQKTQFATGQLQKIKSMIDAGLTTSVIGIPGTGISVFMKQLSQQPFGHMFYVDVFSLPDLKTRELFTSLLEQLGGQAAGKSNLELVQDCLARLKKIATEDGQPIVIVVSGFDKLAADFNMDFFRYLRSLRSVPNTVFVFGICRRLETILPVQLTNLDLRLFANIYYLDRYSEQDLRTMLDIYGPKTDLNDKAFKQIVKLSGGHFQFLQLLLQSEYRQQPTADPFIKLSFENIWSHLSTPQKAIVRKLVHDGSYSKTDNYLTNVGIIKKTQDRYELFSPLFANCVRAYSAPKLPVKERRLLTVLKRHEGRIVSKRDIYDAVWRGEEVGSEWALNALIYRLRKHPSFISQKYSIENHKKSGYSLTKNTF